MRVELINTVMSVSDFAAAWPAVVFLAVFVAGLALFVGLGQPAHVSKEVDSAIPRFLIEYAYWLADLLVGACRALRITPNDVTALSAVLAVGAAYALALGELQLGAQVTFFAVGLDLLDGHLARVLDMKSESGAFLDSFVDRLTEGMLFFGLAYYGGGKLLTWAAIGALIGSFMVSYARARGESLGVSFGGGWMRRPERLVTLLLGLFFAPIVAVWMPSITVIQVLTLTLMFIGVLSFATAAKRVWVIMSRLDRSASVNRLDRSASMNRLDRSASAAPGELLEQHGHGT